jgi:hypothetical protein
VPIEKEDQEKTTFVSEFGSFAYRVMPFGLKNAPTVFLRIVVKVHFKSISKKPWLYTLMTRQYIVYSKITYNGFDLC